MLEMLEIEIYPLGDWDLVQTIFSHQSIDYHLILLFSWNVRLFRGFGPNPRQTAATFGKSAKSITVETYYWTGCFSPCIVGFKPNDELVDGVLQHHTCTSRGCGISR